MIFKTKLIDKDKSYTFSDYFSLKIEIDTLLDYFDYKFKVTQFTMLITTNNGTQKPLRSKSNKLTPEMLKFVQSARKNTKLIFTDIWVQGPLEKYKTNSPLLLTLK